MEIMLEGVVSNELIKAATEGRIYPHAVCGVDFYRRPEVAIEDGVEIDESRPCPWADSLFFSGRHYRVIPLLNSDEYDLHSTIASLRLRMIELKVRGAGFLNDNVLEQEDEDTAYVLTPLYDSELDELMESN